MVLTILGFFVYYNLQTNETQTNGNDIQAIISDCISLCEKYSSQIDLSTGPCLSDDNPEWTHKDWVCDVAHFPRLPVDNLPENQCKEYREGKESHFVEVNEQCEYIRHY